MLRPAVDVGPDVAQGHRPVEGGHGHGDARSMDPGQAPQVHLAGGHIGAGVARRDDRVELAGLVHPRQARDGTVRFVPQRLDGRLVHADHVRAIHQVDVPGRCGRFVQQRLHRVRTADQDDPIVRAQQVLGSQRPFDLVGRGQVAAHGVDADSHALAFFLQVQAQPRPYVAAVVACRVGQFRLVAPRAGNGDRRCKGVVGAPAPLAGLGLLLCR